MNIQQKVSLQAQKSKENKTKGRELTEEEAKKQDYQEFIRDSLSEHERELVKKYLDKLAPLGSYQEYNVYEILKKYDWNEKFVEELINGFLKKKEEAGDFEGWTHVKKTEKAPPKTEKEQRGDRKNKRYQKPEKTNEKELNEPQGSRQQENQPEEQRSFRKGQNQDRRRRDFENQGEYQEGYYNKDRYYNQKGGRKYYEKNKSPVYGKKGGYEQVEYVKKSTQNEANPVQSEDQTQKQEENVHQPIEVAKSTHQEKNGTHESHSEHKSKQIERKDDYHHAHESAKKSHKEQEVQHRPSAQQTPQKTKPHSEIPTESQQLKTPERPHETAKTQEHTQGSATKNELQQNPTGLSQGGVPQPMMNPYMMPMMIPPNVKDMQPIFPFPYIVFPQPNGTSIIQPLYQYPLMNMGPRNSEDEQSRQPFYLVSSHLLPNPGDQSRDNSRVQPIPIAHTNLQFPFPQVQPMFLNPLIGNSIPIQTQQASERDFQKSVASDTPSKDETLSDRRDD